MFSQFRNILVRELTPDMLHDEKSGTSGIAQQLTNICARLRTAEVEEGDLPQAETSGVVAMERHSPNIFMKLVQEEVFHPDTSGADGISQHPSNVGNVGHGAAL